MRRAKKACVQKKTGSDPRQVPTPPGALGRALRLYDGIAGHGVPGYIPTYTDTVLRTPCMEWAHGAIAAPLSRQ